jgi:phosphonatase-like hydrolase
MRFSRRHSLAALAAGIGLGTPGSAPAQTPAGQGTTPGIKLIVSDVGGTLIQDHGEVPAAMLGAFSRHGMTVTAAEFSEWRGASKRGMVQHFVGLRGPAAGRSALIEAIYSDFVATASKAYADVQPIAGAEDALKQLRAAGYLIATSTGFDRQLNSQVMKKLNWEHYFAASITSDDVVDGRPSPFMIYRAMEGAHVDNIATVLVVGDTPLDLQAGNNSGAAAVVGVFSGAAGEERLRRERSTAILPSIAALPALLKNGLPVAPSNCR